MENNNDNTVVVRHPLLSGIRKLGILDEPAYRLANHDSQSHLIQRRAYPYVG